MFTWCEGSITIPKRFMRLLIHRWAPGTPFAPAEAMIILFQILADLLLVRLVLPSGWKQRYWRLKILYIKRTKPAIRKVVVLLQLYILFLLEMKQGSNVFPCSIFYENPTFLQILTTK